MPDSHYEIVMCTRPKAFFGDFCAIYCCYDGALSLDLNSSTVPHDAVGPSTQQIFSHAGIPKDNNPSPRPSCAARLYMLYLSQNLIDSRRPY